MVGDTRQGWALFAAMSVHVPRRRVRRVSAPNRPAIPISPSWASRPRRPRRSPAATWKARRSASASPRSALFATVTTDASCGAVNGMHDSFTPLGRPGAAVQHADRRGDLRRRRRRPLRHAALRHPGRLHRRPDGRPHAGVPRQEDRAEGSEDGDARAHRDCGRASCVFTGVSAVIQFAKDGYWNGRYGAGHRQPEQRRPARLRARSSTPTRAARATTAARSPASAPTRPGTTSRSAWRC